MCILKPMGLTQQDYEELEKPRKIGETKVAPPPRRCCTVVHNAVWFAAWTIVFLFALCLYGFLVLTGRKENE